MIILPAEYFNAKPSENGAWLVKNCWGTDWGDGGYFWISYAEKLSDVYSIESEKAQANMNLFQYDDYGGFCHDDNTRCRGFSLLLQCFHS